MGLCPQPQIPNPQSPIPNPHKGIILIILKKYLIFKMKIKLRNLKLLKIIYKDLDK
jgi:hypothetical protein